MRITLHAVHADDHRSFHEAMQTTLRAARLNDRRFRSTGLSVEDADALVPHLLAFADRPRGKAEVEGMLAERLGGPPEPGVWWALRTFAPLVHAPTGGPWSFGSQPSYLSAPTVPAEDDRDRCVERLVWRYLEGFGPATAQDVAQFALLRMPTIRPALAAMADALTTSEGPDGTELFDVPDAPMPGADTPAPPRLLPMWDSALLAYADRSRIVPPEYRQLVARRNGDVLPTLLVDGYVCGVWRPVDGAIEATAFHTLEDEAWEGLADEARGLVALLADRDPTIYGRYARWWADLPTAEVNTLPA
jgi:hypothetical protein